MKKLNIYWARRDFRLLDNPALYLAVKDAYAEQADFLPLFILENYMVRGDSDSQFGLPARYMIAHAVPQFAKQFKEFLTVRGQGANSIISVVKKLTHDYSLVTIHVNEDVYIDFYKQIKKLQKHGIDINIYHDRLTIPHGTKTGTGNYYSVFTPFRNAVWNLFINAKTWPKPKLDDLCYPSRETLARIPHQVEHTTLALWDMVSHKRTLNVKMGSKSHEIDLDQLLSKSGDYSAWYTCEHDALSHFKRYLQNDLADYKQDRDSLELNKTSRMSVALAWGFVSARTLTKKIIEHFDYSFENPYAAHNIGGIHFISELIWREFYAYIIFHNPKLMHVEFQSKFRGTILWTESKMALKYFALWVKGETGYPVVDAAMKEIAQTGHMHNRARMIVSSFLTKHLGVDWKWGQEYFRAMLIDIDECSNNGGWQWGASVGADPKPIRIFNPTIQAKNYDPNNVYQKKWLGNDFDPKQYIEPIVEHKQAREQALARYGLSHINKENIRDY